MSAFIVSDRHLDAIVSVAERKGLNPTRLGLTSYQDLRNLLEDANYASVNFRYNGTDRPEYKEYQRIDDYAQEPLQNLKLIQCFDYQACEVNDWIGSKAWIALALITDRLVSDLTQDRSLEWAI